MNGPIQCVSCNVEMVEGYIPDIGHSAWYQQRWVPGIVNKGWLGGPWNHRTTTNSYHHYAVS